MDAKIIERIKALETSGVITPDAVLADAENPDSPLHDQFEWDDSVAARKYRIDQARQLIRSVRVVVMQEKHQISTIAYVRSPDAEHDEQGYTSTVTLRTDKEKAQLALLKELQRAECALQRAYDVADALGLSKKVESLLAQLRKIRSAA